MSDDSTDQPMAYEYRQRYTIYEWAQQGALVVDMFLRGAREASQAGGYPPPPGGTEYEVVGLRPARRGTLDEHGNQIERIECQLTDPRVVAVELRMRWESQP